jgi:stage III sporulation protein AE
MTIFTAVLTIKQLITTSLDDVSTRAVRFTLNSFIPIVGSALSDAYKTVQGSIGLLKSGVGVFVILSVAVVFLPVILQSLMWIITLWLGKSVAEVLSLSQPAKLIEAVATVFSTLLAILLCIMSIYIISTAIVLIAGRSA